MKDVLLLLWHVNYYRGFVLAFVTSENKLA